MGLSRGDVERLIERVARRDRGAFLALYDATGAKLHGVCLRVLKDPAEAEDALQDAFVKVWRHADRYRANGLSPMTWLIAVARNSAIDRLRGRRAGAGGGDAALAQLSDPAPGPEALAVAASQAREIARCLEELPDTRAQAVRGAYLDGQSYRDLARRFGVPLNTMRTWLRRSLVKLRECLEG